MKKLDFKASFGPLYFPPTGRVVELKVPRMRFAMVDGLGNPNGSVEYRESLQALFGVSYTLKFALKRAAVLDYRVGPLEGLWWTGPGDRFVPKSKRGWHWTSLILQPAAVTPRRFRDAVSQLRERHDSPAVPKLRLEDWTEGLAAQTMHVGPYSLEEPTISRVHAFIEAQGGRPAGKHHEIYLGDPRRSAPEKLRTVIRQPFSRRA